MALCINTEKGGKKKNSSHSNHSLVSLLHSGECYRSIKTNMGRFQRSYFSQVISALNGTAVQA